MSKIVHIFFTGMLISFLGSLPLGTLNIAAMRFIIMDLSRDIILLEERNQLFIAHTKLNKAISNQTEKNKGNEQPAAYF